MSRASDLSLESLLDLADRAGAVVLEHYDGGTEVRTKADRSPVTAADEAAEAVILEGLRGLAPDLPVVAEEAVAAGRIPDLGDGPFWLVDPLDGTREFLSGNGEFTVNIALVEGTAPLLGVVLAPARSRRWWGRVGEGAWTFAAGDVRRIEVRPPPASGPVAVASRSHRDDATNAFLERQGVSETVSAGSSLKFCLVAEGSADVYPRFGTTMEWDTAAGQAVLAAAGGRVTTPENAPFVYRKPDFRNGPFIAWGGPA